jgi:hypothetical protein
MIAFLIALLAFFGWWLSRSKISWHDRLLAFGVPIVCGAIVLPFADKTINWFAILLTSFPYVMAVWTAWLFIARSFEPRVQRIGFCVAMFFTIAPFALIRWDGLDAVQRAEFHWRWTPTKEQEFLTAHGHIAGEAAKAADTAKPWTVQLGDSPEFRGPQRDGVLTGVTVVADWNEHPPKQLWKKRVGPGWSDPGGVELPRLAGGGGKLGGRSRNCGEPGTGCSGAVWRPWRSISCKVGSGCNGPGQMSPGSVVSAGESTCSPTTRRMFSLSPAGKFGLEPVVNGGSHQVL